MYTVSVPNNALVLERPSPASNRYPQSNVPSSRQQMEATAMTIIYK